MEIRCGPLRYEDWNGFWMADSADSRMPDEEYDQVWKEWMDRLDSLGFNQRVYFRGDNLFGDRTQYLEICDAKAFDLQLLSTVQRWLWEPSFRNWRVFVQTYLGPAEAIMIYPSAIMLGRRFDDQDLADTIRSIRARMIAEGIVDSEFKPRPSFRERLQSRKKRNG